MTSGSDPQPHLVLASHQARLVDNLMRRSKGRVVVRTTPGSGLTTSLAVFCARWIEQNPGARVLVVVRHPLQAPAWTERLEAEGADFVVVDAAGYRRLEADTPASENPWSTTPRAIVGVDTLKMGSRLGVVLAVAWDVVVLHSGLSLRRGSARAEAIEGLWRSDSVRLLVLANPLQDDFELSPELAPGPVTTWRFEWRASARGHEVEVLRQPLSESEQSLFQAVASLDPGSSPLPALACATVQRRAASSIYALDETLRRLEAGLPGYVDAPEPEGELDLAIWDGPSLGPEPEGSAAARSELRRLVDLVEEVESDSKVALTAELLFESGSVGMCPVVFTDYADTAFYLVDVLRSQGRGLIGITAQTPQAERAEALQSAQDTPAVLVITTAAASGLDLGFASGVVHFDLPPTAGGLEQRVSTVRQTVNGVVTRSFVIVDGVLVTINHLPDLGIQPRD